MFSSEHIIKQNASVLGGLGMFAFQENKVLLKNKPERGGLAFTCWHGYALQVLRCTTHLPAKQIDSPGRFSRRSNSPAHAWSIGLRHPHSGLSAGTVGADSSETGHTCNSVSFPGLPGEDGGSNSGKHFQESFYLTIT